MKNRTFHFLLGLGTLALAVKVLGGAAADDARIVRTATPKVIDGGGADWADVPVAQAIPGPNGAATVKLAYDADNFYALFRVGHPRPFGNGASDPAMILKGGDAVGLVFGPANGTGQTQRVLVSQLNGKPVVEVYRPQSAVKKPYTFSSPVGQVTLDYVAPLPEARAAFRTTPNGYQVEISIPWRVLGYRPAAGLTLPFDAQVIWADASGTTNAETHWWHSVGSGPLAVEDLPTEAQLYPSAWGEAQLTTANAAHAAPAPPLTDEATGSHTVGDTAGTAIDFALPVAAKVSLRLMNDQDWGVRDLVDVEPMAAGTHRVPWDGRDDYGDPLPPGKYHWLLGYFQGIGSRRLGGAGNSAKPPYRTADGKGDLGAVHGYLAGVAADVDGVYHLGGTEEGNPGFTKLRPDGVAVWKHSLGGFGTGKAVATAGGFVYLLEAVNKKTVLIQLDAQTGRAVPLGGQPQVVLGDGAMVIGGLAVAGGKAYFSVPAENRLGVVDTAMGALGSDIAVPQPQGLCRASDNSLLVCSGTSVLTLDISTGRQSIFVGGLDAPRAVTADGAGAVYVSDLGASQQIKRYVGGRLQAAFGVPGGRPATDVPYDPNGLQDVISLAVGPDGNLWFAEGSDLRRVGVITSGGRWVKDVFETIRSQGGVGVDLQDPTRVFYHPGYRSFIAQAKVDTQRGTWKLEAVHRLTQTPGYADAPPTDLAAHSADAVANAPIAFTAKTGQRYLWIQGALASLWLQKAGAYVPILITGNTGAGNGAAVPAQTQILWADANGNGKIESGEVETTPTAHRTWRWIGPDLTLYASDGYLPPVSVSASGVPSYRLADLKPYITSGHSPKFYFRDGSYGITSSPPGAGGGQYFAFNIGAGPQHSFWDRDTYSRLAYARDGRIQWIVGHHDGRKLHDGDLSFIWGALGEVDGVVVVADVDFQLLAYTGDGLALGGLAPTPQHTLTPEAIVQENVQQGEFLKDPQTGKPIVVVGTGTEAQVAEVTGIAPGDIHRLTGTVTLISSQPRSPQTPGRYQLLYRTWPNVSNGHAMGVSGDDWSWRPEIPDMAIYDGKTLIGDVRLRRDAGALHVYATVLAKDFLPTATPAAYGKSDGVELRIGPADPSARDADTCLFLTAQRGVVDANEQQRFTGSALAGRTGTPLTPIPGAKVAVRESLNDQGYHLEAQIPLAALPALSQPTSQTFLRNYWPGAKKPGDFLERYTQTLPDLNGPVRLNVAIWRSAGGMQRLPWVQDGVTTANLSVLNPAAWGVADVPEAPTTP